MAEPTPHNAIGTATAFAWACPACRAALVLHDDGAVCRFCGTRYARCEAIWRLLPPGRDTALCRFVADYDTIRACERWGSPDAGYFRALPHVPRHDPNRTIWDLRVRTFQTLETHVLDPLEQRHASPLRLLDVGAGNGWLAYRLARRGHLVAAVDLRTGEADGLGAHRHFDSAFTPVQADFDRLPFAAGQFDAVVFNGSLHYAPDYTFTLAEALRVLKPAGRLVVMDSPVYRDPAHGRRMVYERTERFVRDYGVTANARRCEHYLTWNRLDALAAHLCLRWYVVHPPYGWRWTLRRWRARWQRRRPPAAFPVLEATPHPDPGSP